MVTEEFFYLLQLMSLRHPKRQCRDMVDGMANLNPPPLISDQDKGKRLSHIIKTDKGKMISGKFELEVSVNSGVTTSFMSRINLSEVTKRLHCQKNVYVSYAQKREMLSEMCS